MGAAFDPRLPPTAPLGVKPPEGRAADARRRAFERAMQRRTTPPPVRKTADQQGPGVHVDDEGRAHVDVLA